MADRMCMTDSQKSKLLEIYRDYECLWNPNSPLYTNRKTRNAAHREIWERLAIPEISLESIPGKLRSLRRTYQQLLRKVDNSRVGVAKAPLFDPKAAWYKTADGFLKKIAKSPLSGSHIDDDSSDEDSEAPSTNTESSKPEPTPDENIQNNKNVVWVVNHISTPPMQNQNDIASQNFIVPSTNVIQTDKRNDDGIKEAIAKLDEIANRITKSATEKEEDEYDTFGKYIAMTLRYLPKDLAIIGKTNIQKAISEIQMKALEKSCPSIELAYGASSSSEIRVKIERDP